MWHASVSSLEMRMSAATLQAEAFRALGGVGDPRAGEWEEWTGRAFHLRRRLNKTEEELVGPAVDIRGTDELDARLRRVRHLLPDGWKE